MKPLSAKWITSAYNYLRSESGMVRGGFIEAGIVEALDQDETEDQAPMRTVWVTFIESGISQR